METDDIFARPLTDAESARTLKDRSKHYQSHSHVASSSSIIGTVVLAEERVAEYQALAEKESGRDLTLDEARREATRLVEYFLLLARPLPHGREEETS